MGVQSIVLNIASAGKMSRELSIEAVEDGALGYDSRSLSSDILCASLIDDRGKVFDNICNRHINELR